MLKLIQVEFLKLRRRKFIWLMLLTALFMPLAAVFYFSSVKGTGVDPIMFYKWTAFSYTPWIILPVVLGMLCTMLMYNENQYDMLKQLWIVPVNKMAYFFSKFAVVLVYSICFMLVTATASILTGVLSGYIPFDSESVLYLLWKCMEISLLTAFAVLPVLAVAAAQKGYILPVCLTLIYTFLGFILLMVNMYLHPLSSMTAIVMYDIPGVVFDQPLNIPAAFLCIGVWATASAVLANVACPFSKIHNQSFSNQGGKSMAFINQAVTVLQTLVIALGAGLAVWGVINLMEGYGNDNPAANAHVR